MMSLVDFDSDSAGTFGPNNLLKGFSFGIHIEVTYCKLKKKTKVMVFIIMMICN